MTTFEQSPQLRLVCGDDDRARRQARRHREVTTENRRAACNAALDPTDPRWVLAVRAYAQLQGAALTWDRRERVLRAAEQLGLRTFDANLIIAIVQDQARRGRHLEEAASSLALLDPPARLARGRRARITARWLAALGAALVANAFLIWWLTG